MWTITGDIIEKCLLSTFIMQVVLSIGETQLAKKTWLGKGRLLAGIYSSYYPAKEKPRKRTGFQVKFWKTIP